MIKNWMKSGWAVIVVATALLGAPLSVQATVVTYDLSFDTTGQSIWDTGSSTTLDQTTFLGVAWQNQTVGFDAIAGDATNAVLNPLRLTYDAAFAACRLAFSASACINGQSAQVPVPALGSRPSVRSCSWYQVSCNAARLVDISARAAYDVAFAACTVGFSASVCRNGQAGRLPVVALGTAPAQYLNVDTRTGVALNGTTDGRVGLELGVQVDSGSVAATVSYQATLDIPDTATNADKTISFNPNSQLAGINTLDTSFANIAVSVDAVMQLSGAVSATGCIIPAGCYSGGDPFNIDETAPILSFNEDGEGGILLLGQSPSDFGLPAEANGFPLDLDVAGLATVTLYLPKPDASGGLDNDTQTLRASGQDDLVDLTLDLDNIVATAAGLPGLFGSSVDIPVLGTLGFDIINVTMGPRIDLEQDFELDPTLYVSLAFDKAVEVGGQLVTELRSAWDMLPDITFLDDVTTVTPTFFVEADLTNHTLLDFGLGFGIDLLQIYYDFGLLGDGTLGIGNVLDKAVHLFDSPDLYTNLFDLQGFNLQIGDPFVIDFQNGSKGPDSSIAMSAINEIVLPADVTIPEPGTIVLLLIGLCGLYAMRRRAFLGGKRVIFDRAILIPSAARCRT
jgi:PEP-CTERM motif